VRALFNIDGVLKKRPMISNRSAPWQYACSHFFRACRTLGLFFLRQQQPDVDGRAGRRGFFFPQWIKQSAMTISDSTFAQKGGRICELDWIIASLAYKGQINQLILISGGFGFCGRRRNSRAPAREIDFVLDPMWSTIRSDLHEHIDGPQGAYVQSRASEKVPASPLIQQTTHAPRPATHLGANSI